MTNEKSIKILSFITPGARESCVRAWLTLSKTSIPWGWFRQTQKDRFDDVLLILIVLIDYIAAFFSHC